MNLYIVTDDLRERRGAYWCRSVANHEERWGTGPFDSKGEAIEEARAQFAGEGPAYVARAVLWPLRSAESLGLLVLEDVLERLGLVAHDDVGEVAEDWLTARGGVSPEVSSAAKALVEAILDDDPPGFWVAVDVEEVDLA